MFPEEPLLDSTDATLVFDVERVFLRDVVKFSWCFPLCVASSASLQPPDAVWVWQLLMFVEQNEQEPLNEAELKIRDKKIQF